MAGVSATYSNNNAAVFDDTSANQVVTITSTGVSPSALIFNNNAKPYTVQGGSITGSVSPSIQGGGTVIFSNTNTYGGATQITSGSTLQVNSLAALPVAGSVNLLGNNSTLTLNYTDSASTGTYAGTITSQGGLPAINVPAGTVTLNGVINTATVGFTKTGNGTLVVGNAQASANSSGAYNGPPSYISGGFLELNSVYGANAGASYSALGAEPINIAGGASGGGLWLNNVQVGVEQNQTDSAGDGLGYVYLFSGGTLKGTGANASLARSSVQAVLNWNGSVYSPGTVYLTTGTSRSDVLSLRDPFEQFDPNYFQANEYVNYVLQSSPAGPYISGSNATNANYLVTAVVQGAGTVKLQSGDTASADAFGGAWSIGSSNTAGITSTLQLGPFVSTTAATSYLNTGNGQWTGAAARS